MILHCGTHDDPIVDGTCKGCLWRDRNLELKNPERLDAFAYLATLAILVLRGDADVAPPGPIKNGSSYVTERVRFGDIDLMSEHKICVRAAVPVVYGECDPTQIAEALLVELAGFSRPARRG